MTDTLLDQVVTTVVVLLGSGRLHDAIRPVLPDSPGEVRVVVLATDTTGLAGHLDDARAMARRHGCPWLPVRITDGHVLIGPVTVPRTPGCPTCAWRRHQANRSDRGGHDALVQHFGDTLARPSTLINPVVGRMVAAVVADEARLLVSAPDSARTRRTMLRIELASGHVSQHRVLPDPRCPDCAALPLDSAELARVELLSRRKVHPRRFRVNDLALGALEDSYVDDVTGFLASVDDWTNTGSVTAVARLAPATATHASQHGYGRSDDLTAARTAAIMESLERYAGMRPRGRRTHVSARYVDIADQALDPRDLGLHSDEQYAQPGFPLRPFDPESPMRWVWGYSFAREEPILVPETCVYYGLGRSAEPFVYEISSGCAIGGGLEEAILYGLLEVAERDAFLMTWYARLPVPRIDLDSAADRRIPLIAEQVRQEHGYDLYAFSTVLEQRVPCFWTMGVGEGFTALCAAGAHPDAERALLSGLLEIVSTLPSYHANFDAEAGARMVADSGAVHSMDDHSTLYGHPDAFGRLGFLFDGPERSVSDITTAAAWPSYGDLADDVAELVGRYLASGLDVIVVDQTALEHRAARLACVKVLLPGTLPMTFGHHLRRVNGIARLRTVPSMLGYRDRDLRPDEINPYPHPFP